MEGSQTATTDSAWPGRGILRAGRYSLDPNALQDQLLWESLGTIRIRKRSVKWIPPSPEGPKERQHREILYSDSAGSKPALMLIHY